MGLLLSSPVPAQSETFHYAIGYVVCLPECCVFEVGHYEDPMFTEEPVFEEREVAALFSLFIRDLPLRLLVPLCLP